MNIIGDEAAAIDGSHIRAHVSPPKPLNKKETILELQARNAAEAMATEMMEETACSEAPPQKSQPIFVLDLPRFYQC